jgi:hypothetical protein
VNSVVLSINKKQKTPNGPFQSYFPFNFDLGEGIPHRGDVHCGQVQLVRPGENLQPAVCDNYPMVMQAGFNDLVDASIEALTTTEDNDEGMEDGKPKAFSNETLDIAVEAAINAINTICQSTPLTPILPPGFSQTTEMRPFRLYREVPDSPQRMEDPVYEAHGRQWYDMPHAALQPMNGNISYRPWSMQTAAGDIWRDGKNADRSISQPDVFLQVFPPKAFQVIYLATQNHIHGNHWDDTRTLRQELLKFFGICCN